jgi:hypothetical protein
MLTHPDARATVEPTTAPVAGLLRHVTPVSLQVPGTARTVIRPPDGSVTKTRSTTAAAPVGRFTIENRK